MSEYYADFRGEWWLNDSGAVYADGDIGDRGHEAVVIGDLTAGFLSSMGIQDDEPCNLNDHENDIREWLNEEHEGRFSEEEVQNDPLECARKVLAEEWVKKNGMDSLDQFDDAWFCACGCGNHDARVYAMKYLGWKRVRGREIETWNLTDYDLKEIADGLADIANGLDPHPDTVFNIEVRSTKKYYTDIPWSIVYEGKAEALMVFA